MGKVEQFELAEDFSISRVLTGLWQIADMERHGHTLDPVMTSAQMWPYIKAGFTTFDMADHYGSSEVITGTFKKNNPDQAVQLLTKWVPPPGRITREMVSDAVQLALDRMQSSQIDLLQFHAWNYADPSWLDGLFYLQECKDQGLIRHIGVTNFDTVHLHMALETGIPIVSNQICFSLLDRRPFNNMLALTEKYPVKVLAFGTLAGGFLTNKWLNQPEPVLNEQLTWSQMKYKRFIDVAGGWTLFQELLSTLNSVGNQKGVPIANIAARYVLQQPGVAGIIIGARLGESAHIASNTQLFEFNLNEADLFAIESVLAKFSPIPGDSGDEYRKPPFLTASGDLSHHLESFPSPYPVVTNSMTNNDQAFSGTIWEEMAGFCRALKRGNQIFISGTTATHGMHCIGGSDVVAQTHFVIDKIEGALQSLGSKLEDVVRTRIFVQYQSDWEKVSKVHGQRFKHIQPANTLVGADIIGGEYLVEIEAEAVIS